MRQIERYNAETNSNPVDDFIKYLKDFDILRPAGVVGEYNLNRDKYPGLYFAALTGGNQFKEIRRVVQHPEAFGRIFSFSFKIGDYELYLAKIDGNPQRFFDSLHNPGAWQMSDSMDQPFYKLDHDAGEKVFYIHTRSIPGIRLKVCEKGQDCKHTFTDRISLDGVIFEDINTPMDILDKVRSAVDGFYGKDNRVYFFLDEEDLKGREQVSKALNRFGEKGIVLDPLINLDKALTQDIEMRAEFKLWSDASLGLGEDYNSEVLFR